MLAWNRGAKKSSSIHYDREYRGQTAALAGEILCGLDAGSSAEAVCGADRHHGYGLSKIAAVPPSGGGTL